MAKATVLFVVKSAGETRVFEARLRRYSDDLDLEASVTFRNRILEKVEFDTAVIEVVPSMQIERVQGKTYDRVYVNTDVPEEPEAIARSREQHGDIPVWLEAFMVTSVR